MIETNSIQFPDLATKFNASAQDNSNLRRIKAGPRSAHFAHDQLDYRLIACVLMRFVPTKKCRISIDRMNWQLAKDTSKKSVYILFQSFVL